MERLMYLENDVNVLRGAVKLHKEEKALSTKSLLHEKHKNHGIYFPVL